MQRAPGIEYQDDGELVNREARETAGAGASGGGRRRAWVFRILTMILGPAVFLLLLEGTLRLFGYGYPTGFFIAGPESGRMRTNGRFGWRFFPRSLARAPVVCSIRVPKPDDTTRVFVLGGSAVMGTPEPAYGVSRFIEAMLHLHYPGRRFEVVNAAMTAINSHVVLPIARDCARLEPDVCVIYMGNNEVVGPFGCGSAFSGALSKRPIIRFRLGMRATRVGQWLSSMLEQDAHSEWKGMEMFLDQRASDGDPRLQNVYDHLRANLEQICGTLSAAGARVLVCTVATNLRDSPPFASDPGGQGADAWYRAGREAEACGESSRALAAFRRARDLDTLRFRADSNINTILRETAGGLESVVLVDVAGRLTAFRDDVMFYEHVHLTPEGNYQVARLLFAELVAPWSRGELVEPPSFADCAAWLALTEWDRYRMAADISDMMSRAPFTNQMDHEARRAERETALHALGERAMAPGALAEARQVYAGLLARRSEDTAVCARLARLLSEMGDHAAAVGQWRMLTKRFSGVVEWESSLGVALSAAGRYDEAIEVFRSTMRMHPQGRVKMLYNIGSAHMEKGEVASAEEAFRRALDLEPESVKARNGLAVVLVRTGRSDEAVLELNRALRTDRQAVNVRGNLGAVLQSKGDLVGALEQYCEALRLRPADVDTARKVAALLSKTGRAAEAVPYYRLIAERAGDDAGAWYNLGAVLQRLGRMAEALRAYDRCLALEATHLRAGHNRGDALAALGRVAEASEQYRRVLTYHPDSKFTRHNLARLLGANPEDTGR